ncbi:MAG TPA: hypothetical protein VKV28_12795 [Candidatus Binataceae bacterium]|nr:hypothetical protein [Candidatus Binataceae bacterium]
MGCDAQSDQQWRDFQRNFNHWLAPPRAATYHHHHTHHKALPPTELATTGPALKPPQPVLTRPVGMEGEPTVLARTRAEMLVDATRARFATIDRSNLRNTNAALYDQANGFLGAAEGALRDNDYDSATGFATKASLLTRRLQSSP